MRKKLSKIFIVLTLAIMTSVCAVNLTAVQNIAKANVKIPDGTEKPDIMDMWSVGLGKDYQRHSLPIKVNHDKMDAELGTDVQAIFNEVIGNINKPIWMTHNLIGLEAYISALDILNYYYFKFKNEDGTCDLLENNNFMDTLKKLMSIPNFQRITPTAKEFSNYDEDQVVSTLKTYVESKGYKFSQWNFRFTGTYINWKTSIKLLNRPVFTTIIGNYYAEKYESWNIYKMSLCANRVISSHKKKIQFSSYLWENRFETTDSFYGNIHLKKDALVFGDEHYTKIKGVSIKISK